MSNLWFPLDSHVLTQQLSGTRKTEKSALTRNLRLPSHNAWEGNGLCPFGKGKLLWKSRLTPSFPDSPSSLKPTHYF